MVVTKQACPSSIESNLRCLLCHINVLVECAVRCVFLLLDGCAELQQFFRNWLTRSVEDIDKPVDVMLASVLRTLE
jgi:hypothetical protein